MVFDKDKVKIIGIITARGGSKSIPKKNIIDLKGKPLIWYSIEAALKSKYINDVYVTSDDNSILEISSGFGAEIIKRPVKLATDDTTSEAVIDQLIDELISIGKQYDILILLQPTSPLRNEVDIDLAFEQFFSSNATALISVFEPKHSPFKALTLDKNGYIEGICKNDQQFKRRQHLPKAYMPNGAIYIISVSEFKKSKLLRSDKTIPFVMSPKKSIDIDDYDDLKLCREILKN